MIPDDADPACRELIDRVLTQLEASGVDRMTAMLYVLGLPGESTQEMTERLQRDLQVLAARESPPD